MRLEMREYIRVSTTLLELSREEGALTGAECDAIVSLAQDLEKTFGPSRQQGDAVGGVYLLRTLMDEIPQEGSS
jgi:hypothetical protein